MVNSFEKMGVTDQLKVIHIRDGEVIDRRVTLGHSRLATWVSKLLSTFGIKKYTIDLITNEGKSAVAQLIGGSFTYVAIGSDDGTILALDATNTALGSEVDRQAGTVTYETVNVTNDTVRIEATFNFSASVTVQESGVFDASSDGTMLCRQTFPALNMQDGDQLVMIWRITVQ